MWSKRLLILGVITVLVAPVNAKSVSLGPQVGYYKVQDADQGDFMGGVAWRFRLTPMLGLEASINYRQEKYADDVLTVRSWPIMVTGLIYPFPRVYGAIGAGWYSTTFDYDQNKFSLLEDETTLEFGWHFGGGVELPVGSNFKLTTDLRYVFLNYDFNTIMNNSDLNSNFYIITAGFLLGL